MSSTSVNNKRIAKNTLFLYFRMIVIMAISLYTVRAILHQLGVVDYGIYNVVGGVVSMFSFLNGTLATSSQRYFSIELAKGDMKRLNQWVCLNITTFSIFIIILLVIAETIGLWFVNYKMTIPEERMFAANVVYQLSIVTFSIHFFNVPYNALIIAHERMSAFAYISIIEAASKLVIVFLLSISTWDKLIVYGILMFLVSCGVTSSYIIYNLRHFEEAKFRPYWNTKEIKELLGFSGWHFFGTFSVVVRSQGINILLNLFFNPAINAARAVAYQIYSAVSQLSHNFFVAVKPQIYKSYAAGEKEFLYKLILRSTTMSSLLVSMLIFPILANTHYILSLWLKEIPDYAVIFTQLVLVNGLVDTTNGPTTASVLATGKIRKYEMIVGGLFILNLPISYIALKFGCDPTVTMVISIVIAFFVTFVRAFFMCNMIGFVFSRYIMMFIRLLVTCFAIWIISNLLIDNEATNIITLTIQSVSVFLITLVCYAFIAFDRDDLVIVINYIKKRLK